jgi:hypothetical protein
VEVARCRDRLQLLHEVECAGSEFAERTHNKRDKEVRGDRGV